MTLDVERLLRPYAGPVPDEGDGDLVCRANALHRMTDDREGLLGALHALPLAGGGTDGAVTDRDIRIAQGDFEPVSGDDDDDEVEAAPGNGAADLRAIEDRFDAEAPADSPDLSPVRRTPRRILSAIEAFDPAPAHSQDQEQGAT